MVSYLLASGLTFSFPLLSERFSVCLSFVYLETMFGSHRSWMARYIGPLLFLFFFFFLSEMGSCLSWSISFFLFFFCFVLLFFVVVFFVLFFFFQNRSTLL